MTTSRRLEDGSIVFDGPDGVSVIVPPGLLNARYNDQPTAKVEVNGMQFRLDGDLLEKGVAFGRQELTEKQRVWLNEIDPDVEEAIRTRPKI